MKDSQHGTTHLSDLLERSRAGDGAARDQLARSVYQRLEQLTRQMLRRYPKVRQTQETGDILNNAWIRFLKALDELPVRDSQHFYSLAATHIRRELIDVARRCKTKTGVPSTEMNLAEAPADLPTQDDLERWCAFHEAVAELPEDERAVFEPVFYHDLSQREVAQQLDVHAKTVQRRYRAACIRLYERLGGKLPTA